MIVRHDPDGTIASVRNQLAEEAKNEWLVFLDADDQLAPGYVAAIEREQARHREGRWLYTPMVSYVHKGGRVQAARFWPEVPFEQGNWLVIGTAIERDLFLQVGGFRDYGDPLGSIGYEDWGLWARCWQAGAQVAKVRRAVYIAHVNPQSRNRAIDQQTKQHWHDTVRRDVFG